MRPIQSVERTARPRATRTLVIVPLIAFTIASIGGIWLAAASRHVARPDLLAKYAPLDVFGGYVWLGPNGGELFESDWTNNPHALTAKPFGQTGNNGPLIAQLRKFNVIPNTMRTSPDGRYVAVQATGKDYGGWVVARADGFTIRFCPIDEDSVEAPWSSAIWFPDSRHFADIFYPGRSPVSAEMFDADSPRVQKMTYASLRGYHVEAAGVLKSGLIDAFVVPGYGMTGYTWGPGTAASIAYIGPTPSGPVTEHVWTGMPHDAGSRPEETLVALSPDGQKIAWLLTEFPHGGLKLGATSWIDDMLNRYWLLPKRTIWISNSDGTDTRLIGAIGEEAQDAFDLQWCPDNKRVSWLTMGKLWAMKVR